ncbi:MAG: beta-galactosidase [Acidimicrobiales bacterium]
MTQPARRARPVASLVVALLMVGGAVAALSQRRAPQPSWAEAPAVGVALGGGVFAVDSDELGRDFDALVEAGVTWVRIDVDWSVIEPEPGTYRWDDPDRVITMADDRGLQVLAMVGYSPAWVRPADTTDKHRPLDVEAFRRFATVAAERYGDTVGGWEVWNEPNLQGFWQPEPDPVAYAEVLAAGIVGLRDGGVATPILSAGLAPSDDVPPVGLQPEGFLRATIEALPDDVRPDAVAVHPYSYPARPGDGQSWNLFGRVPGIERLASELLGAGTEVWLTEYGAPTGTAERSVSEARQAELVGDAIACSAHWDWAPVLFLFTARDWAGGTDGDLEARFGLLRVDGTEKPAFEAMRAALGSEAGLAVSPCG